MSILDDLDYIRQRMREIGRPPRDSIPVVAGDGLLREGDTRTIDGHTYRFDGRAWVR
jgi:hypothetical protein